MKYPIIAKVFFSRTAPLDTAKTCHKGPHELNQDMKLLETQMKLKEKKSIVEFDPRCTLFLSQSRDISEKTPCNSPAVQTCYCNIFSDNFAFVKHVCFLNPKGSTQQMALHV